MAAGYVDLSETAEGKCVTEMSFRQYVGVGCLGTAMLWFTCAVALARFELHSARSFSQ